MFPTVAGFETKFIREFKLSLQRRSSGAVHNCHQIRFLDRCRCVAADNIGLSTAVLESLLISIISSSPRTAANNKY
jgi:hypothetical protein